MYWVIIVSPTHAGGWMCHYYGADAQVVADHAQTTAGSSWECGAGEHFAYCLCPEGTPFYAITNELQSDGLQWEEGC